MGRGEPIPSNGYIFPPSGAVAVQRVTAYWRSNPLTPEPGTWVQKPHGRADHPGISVTLHLIMVARGAVALPHCPISRPYQMLSLLFRARPQALNYGAQLHTVVQSPNPQPVSVFALTIAPE